MSVVVLQSRSEINSSRERLAARGLTREPLWSQLVHILRTGHRRPVPDPVKSWDLERAIEAIEATTPRTATVVDLGAYNSAILPALHRLGYSRLIGIDLDPRVRLGPFANRIQYRVGDFHHMELASESVQVVTAISTIEHGWRAEELLRELQRVLAPGGLFIASTDYWPAKIDTRELNPFGMSWTIFSADEIRALVTAAESFGLRLTGPAQLEARDAVVVWNDRAYTFVLVTLQKAASL